MFIQDFYLGLDGKQRVIVLSATGVSGLFLLCCVLWFSSGGRTADTLSDQERIAITSGETAADRSEKTAAAAALAAPTPKQIEVVRAGLAQGTNPSHSSMQSKAGSRELLEAARSNLIV